MHLFLARILVFCCLLFQGTAFSLADSKTETSGKMRIFSRTSSFANGVKKRDTFVLWTDSVVPEQEEYDSVVVVWGDVKFYGKARDLVVLGGNVTLYESARIEKSLVVMGGKLHKKDGAQVSEQVLFELPENLPRWITFLGPMVAFAHSDSAELLYVLIRAVLICLFGALLYVIAPELMRNAESFALDKPLRSILWSFIGALLFVPGIVLLLISIIGIFFIPLFVLFYSVTYLFCAFVMAANILGHNLPPRDSIVMPPLRFFYGVFIIVLISYIPLIGGSLIYLGMLITSGAMFYTILQRFRGRVKGMSLSK